MSDDLTADDKRIRAERARGALNDLGWAFDDYEAQLMADWGETKPSKSADREAIYHRVKALKAIRGGLQNIVSKYDDDEAMAERKRKEEDAKRLVEQELEQRRAKLPRG